MLELNLNLLVTFFWLLLSAGILLSGVWLLIDCKINPSIIDIIFRYLYNQDDIFKSYFLYCYIFGLLMNLILFILHLSSFFLFIIFILHIIRRLYECMYTHKLNRKSKLNFLQYFIGLIHYPCVGLTIIIDNKYPYTNISFLKYFFALILFFNASYIQYNVYLITRKRNCNQNEVQQIPNDYWIYNYFSCPNSITEMFIYISFFIASHRTSAMASLVVWVFVNQSLSALLNHREYKEFY